MCPRQESALVGSSNPMDDNSQVRQRRSRSLSLLCCCCFGSDDSGADKSLLRPSWFLKSRRSNSGQESYVDSDSQNWWGKGWTSVRRAGEWSESLVDDYTGSCCSGPKWKHFVRRFKADGKSIYNTKPAKFHYDPLSYELNFDDGSRHQQNGEFQQPYQGVSSRTALPASRP